MKRAVWLCVFLLSSQALADFTINWREGNYFLTEYRFWESLDLDQDNNPLGATELGSVGADKSNNRAFLTLKLRLNPTIQITDRLAVYSSFDVLTAPYATDSGLTGVIRTDSHEGGDISGRPPVDNVTYGPVVGGDTPTPRALFGHVTTAPFGQSSLSIGDSNFLVRQLWGEYTSDWGVFKAGRQPRHFGLGIRWNAGGDVFDKFGDVTDTVMYELALGNFKVGGGYTKILEQNIDDPGDDATEWDALLRWFHPEREIDFSFMFSFLKSGAAAMDLSVFDAFLQKRWKWIRFGVEGVGSAGNAGPTSNVKAQQIGIATECELRPWDTSVFTAKIGYARGQHRLETGKLTLFAFDRNYDIALLLFNQGLGSVITEGIRADSPSDTNAIHNAYYAAATGRYDITSDLFAQLGLAWAVADQELFAGQKKDYGVEVDTVVGYHLMTNVKTTLECATLFPGQYFEETTTTTAGVTRPLSGDNVYYVGVKGSVIF